MGLFEEASELIALHEAAARRNGWVHDLQQSESAFHVQRERLHFGPAEAERAEGGDVGAHARSDDHVDLDAVFLKDLDDTDVRVAFGTAARQGQTDSAAADIRARGTGCWR